MNSVLQLGFKSFLNPSSFAVSKSRLRIATLLYFRPHAMTSKRSSVSLASPKSTTGGNRKDSILKRSRGAVSNSDEIFVEQNDCKLDIQIFKDDPLRIEAMTVQELRTTLRTVGIPAKGRKHDLVTALQCFVKKETIGLNSQVLDRQSSIAITSVEVNQKDKHLSDIDCVEDFVDAVGENGARQTKSSRLSTSENENVKAETKISTKKKQPMKSDEASSAATSVKPSRTKRKISPDVVCSIIKNEDGEQVMQNEPWTVLSHKRPEKDWIPYNPRTMRPSPPSKDINFVKILSWNVNGLRALLKLGGFSALKLAEREDFDILCLQETKLQEKDIEAIRKSLMAGYDNSFWTCSVSKLGYSGTAIISRIKPLSVRYGLGVSEHDDEGRLVTVEFDSFYLLNGYVPNSGDGLKRLSYRISQWDPSLSNYMKELEKSKPVILTGDLNCAHQEIDIFNPAGNRRSAGFTDEERQSFGTNFLSKGFVDTFRQQHPNVVGYTYWGYRHGGRKTNKGWRLDYFLVSESIAEKVHDSYILPDVGGSDHCPIGLLLKL